MAYGIADSTDLVNNAAPDALCDIVALDGGSNEAAVFLLPHLEDVLRTGVASKSTLGSRPTANVPKDVSVSNRR